MVSKTYRLFQCSRKISFLKDIYDAGKRHEIMKEYFLESNNFFQSYKSGAHDQALHDVRNILNNNIFWDLKEIWLIDPYLSPNYILNTVMYCEKPNIKIMCLTDLRNLRGKNEDGSKEPIDSLKHRFDVELDSAIPSDTDVQLTYKTIDQVREYSFHDRYIILKYQYNRTRVWSLGTSVNSLGKKHHIMQIVECPVLIAEKFQEVWNQITQENGLIYETHNQ